MQKKKKKNWNHGNNNWSVYFYLRKLYYHATAKTLSRKSRVDLIYFTI